MSSEKEMIVIQKAAIYDILDKLDESDKETYTKEEIKQLAKSVIKEMEHVP